MSSLMDDRCAQAEMLRTAHERLQAKCPEHSLLIYYDATMDKCLYTELEAMLEQDFSGIAKPAMRQLHIMAAYTKVMEDAAQAAT